MRIVHEFEEQEWRDFVAGIFGGSIFQTPEMAKIFEMTLGYEPVQVFVTDKGEIQGLVLASLVSNGKGIFRSFATRCIVQGGPLGLRFRTTSAVLKELDTLVARRALYSEIRNLYENKDLIPLFKSVGFSFAPHLNYLIDLRKGEEQLWSEMSKGRRKGISQAERRNLEIMEIEGESQIDSFYGILSKSYSRVRIPLASKSFFQSAFKILSPLNEVKFYVCKHEDRPIACRTILLFGKTIYDWYAGSLAEEKGKKSDEFLVWNILKWGISEGFTSFDFGGAGSPEEEYGPREFKRRFGGRLIEPGRFKKVYKPTQLWISSRAYDVYRRLE